MGYDPTKNIGEGELLPVGEHGFTITDSEEYEADTGRLVWKFTCETDAGTKRTYRITLGTSMTDDNIQRLIDACGGDPDQVPLDRLRHSDFRDKTFRAWIRHREYQGRTVDDFGCIIPQTYRDAWEQAGRPGVAVRAGQAGTQAVRAGQAGTQASRDARDSRASSPRVNDIHDSEIPF